MATIRTFKDYLGNLIYPKTKIHAVYEETTNTRLDLILGDHTQLTTSNTDLVGSINELNSEKLDKTGDGKDLTTTFEVATVDADFTTSEKDTTKWGKVLKAIQTFRTWLGSLTSNFAPAYSASSTYALGKFCTYNNITYKCTTAITVAEAWNVAKWTVVSLGNEVSTTNDNLVAKVPRQMRGGYAAAIVGAGAWTSVPVVFSNAFTNACDGVVATPYATSGDYRFNILIGSMSKTGCTVKIYNNETASFSGGVTVIAFGY